MGEPVKLPMKKGLGQTDRTDGWWKGPTAMAAYLGFMIVYATWRGFMEADFWIFSDFGYSAGVGHGAGTMAIENTGSHVLSPLYSPLVIPGSGEIGTMVPVALAWMSPAMFILIFPAGFRGTCYYMRRVYYRTFFASPVACWVDEPEINKKIGYKGEKRLFLINNLHRYFLYMVIPILLIKWWDITHTMTFSNNGYGVSGGTIILTLEAVCLTFYVTSCHALRHLAGGMLDRWASGVAKLRGALFSKISVINRSHGFWFWISLVLVFVGDAWTIACSKGMITDFSLVLIGGA